MSLESIAESVQELKEFRKDHEMRIRALELSYAKLAGILLVVSAIGSVAGSILVHSLTK